MSETITTTQLLDFLVKAEKVSSHIHFAGVTNCYRISVCADWDDNSKFYDKGALIIALGYSVAEAGDPKCHYYDDFLTLDSLLDELVKKQEEREIKSQTRQEVLSRLTDEEKELLGLKPWLINTH